MIEQILPATVIAVEVRDDEARDDREEATLFPQEQALLARAIDKRRREFTTGRHCARTALGRLGFAPAPILSGERGEPLWPAGAVGSITHCDGYRAAAVAHASEVATIGIDAEPHAALPDGLLEEIARAEELPMLHRLQHELPEVHWDRLLFSAKEVVYKAWFPLARRWLGFEDVVVDIDLDGLFAVRLLVEGPSLDGGALTGFSGRWLVQDGLMLAAVALRRQATP
jgi:4'-phosphopantetheinyl transferase EntD